MCEKKQRADSKEYRGPNGMDDEGFSKVIIAIPIPIVAAQSAQPIKACTKIMKNFFIFLTFFSLNYWILPL
jgi:hypothetical protein